MMNNKFYTTNEHLYIILIALLLGSFNPEVFIYHPDMILQGSLNYI